jgi:hypothetical protein
VAAGVWTGTVPAAETLRRATGENPRKACCARSEGGERLVDSNGEDSDLAARRQIAEALVNQGVALGRRGRFEEAIRAYEQVVNRYGAESHRTCAVRWSKR